MTLRSLETVEIAGRGTLYVVENPIECSDFKHLIGSAVVVDGKPVIVGDVERNLHAPPWRQGERIGILASQGGMSFRQRHTKHGNDDHQSELCGVQELPALRMW